MHKSIRKYAKFDSKKLIEFIEIDSYDSIETIEYPQHLETKYKTVLLHYRLLSLLPVERLEAFKHKQENSYMVRISAINHTTYLYLDGDLKTLNRNKKPAVIILDNFSIKEKINNAYSVTIILKYYKNGKDHNDFGPTELRFNQINDKFVLSRLEFTKNDLYYNKHGIVCYDNSQLGKVDIVFMKHDVITSYSFLPNHIEIEKALGDYRQIINCERNGTCARSYEKNFTTHRLDGPAYIYKTKTKTYMEWHVNGKKLPDDIIHYKKGLEKNTTKTDVLKAMLFDQEYGEFLKEKLNEIA